MSDFPISNTQDSIYKHNDWYKWLQAKNWSEKYKGICIKYKLKFSEWPWDYNRRVGWALMDFISELAQKAGYRVWTNPEINGNGPDQKFFRRGKLVIVEEAQNRRYNLNYRPYFENEINNLSRFECGRFLIVTSLPQYSRYRKALEKRLKKHNIVFLETGSQLNPYYDCFTDKEIKEYHVVRNYSLETRQRILMTLAEAEERN